MEYFEWGSQVSTSSIWYDPRTDLVRSGRLPQNKMEYLHDILFMPLPNGVMAPQRMDLLLLAAFNIIQM